MASHKQPSALIRSALADPIRLLFDREVLDTELSALYAFRLGNVLHGVFLYYGGWWDGYDKSLEVSIQQYENSLPPVENMDIGDEFEDVMMQIADFLERTGY